MRDFNETYMSGLGTDAPVYAPTPLGEAQKALAIAEKHYSFCQKAQKEAVEAFYAAPLPPVKALDWEMDNEVSYEGMKVAPKWVCEALSSYEAAKKEALAKATDAFMDSDEAETIIDNLIAAKKALSVAQDDLRAATEAQEAAKKESLSLDTTKGWIVCSSRSVASEVAQENGMKVINTLTSVQDDAVVSINFASKAILESGKDCFVPSSVLFYDEEEIKTLGFYSDIMRIKSKVQKSV